MTGSVSEKLAAWLHRLSDKTLPDAVSLHMRKLLLDSTGLAVASRHTDYVHALVRASREGGTCTALGHEGSFSPFEAALINGTAIHGEDFDDTVEEGIVHIGAVVIPAVLAACQRFGRSGADAILGIAAGAEVMCRLSLVAPSAIHRAGFHPTAILGPFGAAAGVSVALKSAPEQMVNAFGIVGSLAGGIIEYLADGTWTKRLHAGWAAQSGIKAALFGREGFAGPRTVFEGRHGLFSGFAPSAKPDFGRLLDSLGEEWQIGLIAFKPHACGTICQPYIDCAAELSRRGVAAENIKEIVCEVGEGSVHRLWEPMSEKHRPSTPYSAKFSVPYCLAVGFFDGLAGLSQFTEDRIKDPAVLELAGKIRYVIDPESEYPRNFTGHLRAVLRDGSVHEIRQPYLRGGVRNPLSVEEIAAKFAANTAFGGWAADTAKDLRNFCETLGDHPNLDRLREFGRD